MDRASEAKKSFVALFKVHWFVQAKIHPAVVAMDTAVVYQPVHAQQ